MDKEYSFYEIAKITKYPPIECLKKWRNLMADFGFYTGWDIEPISIDSKLSTKDTEILICFLTKKENLVELLLEKS